MGNCIERPKNVHNLLITNGTPVSDGPSQDSHPLPTPPLPILTYPGKEGAASPRSETEILSSPYLKSFSFNVLKRATRSFNPEFLIGEGGFGYVYKGWLDKDNLSASRPGDGLVVAVKKLKPEGFQGHKEWLEFNAKLSDFGLAKAGPTGDLTHVSTEVMGTQGYAAPEYLATGRLTAKCDVYSFGVVLLEVLTGRRAVDKRRVGPEQKLLDWVTPQLKNKRKLCRIMDTKLEGQYPQKGAYVAAHLALQCVHDEPRYRPHMADVLAILEKLPSPKSSSAKNDKPSSVESQSLLSEPQPQASPMNMTPRGTSLPAPIKMSTCNSLVVKSLPPPPIKSPKAVVSSLPTHMIKNSLPQSPHGR
ncbi:hypothetical protein LguiA_028213 [Lonicera macranthoides]